MKTAEKIAWTAAAVSGMAAVVVWTYSGYRADELGTSGTATTTDWGVWAMFGVCLISALALTLALALALNKGRHIDIPRSHLLIALIGGIASLILLPAILVPIAVLSYDLLSRPQPRSAESA